MDKPNQSETELNKSELFQYEYDNLTSVFHGVEEDKRKIVDGLINDAAFLYAENKTLKQILWKSGMVIINPKNPEQQKPMPAAIQYLKNVNSYAVIIKTLNSILSKNEIDTEDDDMKDFE